MSVAVEENRRSDAERMAAKRAAIRDLKIPKVRDQKRRDSLKEDDCGWLRTYLPGVFYHPFTPDQKRIVEMVGESLRYGTSKCIAAPRSDGKSSITKYLALKYSLYRQVRFPLVLCATGPKADGALDAIKAKLRSPVNKLLHQDFPLECTLAHYVAPAPNRANNVTVNGGKSIHMEWKSDRIILPIIEDGDEEIGPILMALGITSDQLQGCNVYDIRPDFVMLDDLDSRDSLAAIDGTVAGKIETIIEQNVAGLGGPGRRMGQAMLCTIPSRHSVAFKYSDPLQKPAWSGVRIPRIRKWPERKDLWDEYIRLRQRGKNTFGPDGKPIDPFGREAHRFYEANREEMDRGAELSNPHDFNADVLPDRTPTHISALQKCYDYIADKSIESFQTEHQNDPPEDPGVERTVLTAYHVQHNCRSGLDQRVIPSGTVCLGVGVDVKKLGLHYVVIASDEHANGCIVDYNYHELNTENIAASAAELAIYRGLHDWREKMDAEPYIDQDGRERWFDVALIDRGWKEESWAGQPVERFCLEVGTTRFLPCKGGPNYTPPKETGKRVIVGDNWHISFFGDCPSIIVGADHWKQKVHEGFLLPAPPTEDEIACGRLTLFEPSKARRGQPHLSYAKHITAEVWERRFQAGFKGWKEGWWKDGGQNHYFDATYQALVARSLWGISTMGVPQSPVVPALPAHAEQESYRGYERQRNY